MVGKDSFLGFNPFYPLPILHNAFLLGFYPVLLGFKMFHLFHLVNFTNSDMEHGKRKSGNEVSYCYIYKYFLLLLLLLLIFCAMFRVPAF